MKDSNPILIQLLRHAARGKKRIPKLPRWLPPEPAVRYYMGAVSHWFDDVEQIARNAIYPRLNHLKASADPESVGRDDWGDDFRGIVFGFSEQVNALRYNWPMLLSDTGKQVADFNTVQWRKTLKKAFSIDYVGSEPWIAAELKAFAVNNAAQLKGIQEDAIQKVSGAIMNGLRSGDRAEDIEGAIQDALQTTRGRAGNIARVQTLQLNAQLTKLQQTSAGVEKYKWRGVMDDRERESHRENEGEEFRWDSPPAETGNPGDDPNCRCWAEPVFDYLLEDVGEAEET